MKDAGQEEGRWLAVRRTRGRARLGYACRVCVRNGLSSSSERSDGGYCNEEEEENRDEDGDIGDVREVSKNQNHDVHENDDGGDGEDEVGNVSREGMREKTARCRRCGLEFVVSNNNPFACRYHASVIGSQGHYTMVMDYDGAKQVKIRRWTCCHERSPDAPGCRTGRHLTHDDEDERWEADWAKPYGGKWGYGMRELK
eukprot:CAMPEP_0185850138 /NCGR_PEP_ID=MMETSP1354-20130828/4387_1 /TAXON_ID=708628 /ORGANISM="Erythrolobus madagascarensis, Strain CCMP3276" /LENGTH=198 /DNA_ID=CAMNT_0028550777 /DNA_START=181 /DNA_END=777 /DNA_ORIENTATION=+